MKQQIEGVPCKRQVNTEVVSNSEIELIAIYRDFEAYYEGLSPLDKAIYDLWLATGSETLYLALFGRFFVHSIIAELDISISDAPKKLSLAGF